MADAERSGAVASARLRRHGSRALEQSSGALAAAVRQSRDAARRRTREHERRQPDHRRTVLPLAQETGTR